MLPLLYDNQQRTLEKSFNLYVANVIENCFYVDDCLLSAPDSPTDIAMVNDLRSLL